MAVQGVPMPMYRGSAKCAMPMYGGLFGGAKCPHAHRWGAFCQNKVSPCPYMGRFLAVQSVLMPMCRGLCGGAKFPHAQKWGSFWQCKDSRIWWVNRIVVAAAYSHRIFVNEARRVVLSGVSEPPGVARSNYEIQCFEPSLLFERGCTPYDVFVAKWAKWLPHPCRIGDSHRFRAGGKIRSGPQVGKVAIWCLLTRQPSTLCITRRNMGNPTRGQQACTTCSDDEQ